MNNSVEYYERERLLNNSDSKSDLRKTLFGENTKRNTFQNDDDDDMENFPMTYSIDNSILMHRDAHFGGDFGIMLDYYTKGGFGSDDKKVKEVSPVDVGRSHR